MYTCLIPCQWNSYLCSLDGRTLDTVDFKDDEGLIKQTAVHILIQRHIVAASFIEVLQQIVVG